MKALAITSKGIEDIAALEIKEMIKAKTETKEGCVIFYPKKIEDLCTLCYKAQSVDKVLLLFDFFKIKNDYSKILKEKIKKIDLGWFDKGITFRVSCKKINNDIAGDELCAETGQLIIDKIKKENSYKQKVDLNNPDIIIFLYIFNDNCYLGIDFSGFELNKREYKIFMHPASLRATIAYAMVRTAEFKHNETLLDPFTGSGTIPIEAAFFASGFPVNYFRKNKFAFLKFKIFKKINFERFFKNIDKKIKFPKSRIIGFDTVLGYITNAKKNAKIAGINKYLTLSRVDIDWLDIKRKENSIDKIITNPPLLSRNTDQKAIEKLYNNFFYQAEYILKDNAKIVIITSQNSVELLNKAADKYKFELTNKREVWQGSELYIILVLEKR